MRSLAITAVGVFTYAISTGAHHSLFAEYDLRQEKEYRAIVSSIAWTNPHASMQARVESAGTTTVWLFDLPGPLGLERCGWQRDTVKPDDTLLITAFPAKNGSPRASVHRIQLDQGRVIEIDHPFAYQAEYPHPRTESPCAGGNRGPG